MSLLLQKTVIRHYCDRIVASRMSTCDNRVALCNLDCTTPSRPTNLTDTRRPFLKYSRFSSKRIRGLGAFPRPVVWGSRTSYLPPCTDLPQLRLLGLVVLPSGSHPVITMTPGIGIIFVFVPMRGSQTYLLHSAPRLRARVWLLLEYVRDHHANTLHRRSRQMFFQSPIKARSATRILRPSLLPARRRGRAPCREGVNPCKAQWFGCGPLHVLHRATLRTEVYDKRRNSGC